MFYWLTNYEGERTKDTPVVLWLTGGPDCSSEMAVLNENGPWWVQDDATLTKNPFSWTKVGDVLYVDQPLGTGFSIANNVANFVTNEEQIALHMTIFLTELLKKHPSIKNRPFFLAGESYAGHFIPSIALHLLQNPVEGIALRGVAIGNGWVHPRVQYPAYATFGYDNGLIGSKEYEVALKGFGVCVKLIEDGLWPIAIIECSATTAKVLKNLNPYDIRENCKFPPLCYDMSGITSFLNRADVQERLGVKKKWQSCDMLVHLLLLGDWANQMAGKVGQLLDRGVPVLVYNGDKDFICNW
eukprot:GHVU01172374.1.p1 GENE.GHVU01172374.1~~GHVU01172374.1.p1  ORF type:complete len:299 (+),score=54.66 GHVU01172374.1:524-1420(+)